MRLSVFFHQDIMKTGIAPVLIFSLFYSADMLILPETGTLRGEHRMT